jgi:cytochrome c peroxidase
MRMTNVEVPLRKKAGWTGPHSRSIMRKTKGSHPQNVDKRPSPGFVKAYMHNGYFKNVRRVVEFYSTRDRKPVCPDPFTTDTDAQLMDCWPEPEVANNVNTKELGKLNLTDDQIDAIVAFMKTLSGGYELP